jgi:hypothetical protein
MRQVPYITQLRVAELATALATMFKGEKIYAALQAADDGLPIDFEALMETDESGTPPVLSNDGSFNLHNLKGK